MGSAYCSYKRSQILRSERRDRSQGSHQDSLSKLRLVIDACWPEVEVEDGKRSSGHALFSDAYPYPYTAMGAKGDPTRRGARQVRACDATDATGVHDDWGDDIGWMLESFVTLKPH